MTQLTLRARRQPKTFGTTGLIILQCVALSLIGLLTLKSRWIGMQLGDMNYYETAAQHLVWGQTPYRDFRLAYPPLSLLPFCLPFLFHLWRPLEFWSYVAYFLAESVIWSTLIACLLARLAKGGDFGQDSRGTVTAYLLFVMLSSLLLPWRYDLFPVLLTVAAFRAVLSGRPGWAGILLGLGVAAKLYPIVLMPVLTLYYIVGKKRTEMFRFQAGHWGGILICLLPLIHVPLSALLSFLRFHEMRGLEVESIPAGLIMLAHKSGWGGAKVVANYGGSHLVAPIARPVIACLPGLFGLTYISLLVRCRQSFYREQTSGDAVTPQTLVHYTVAAIVAFIVCNKVFSTQYIFWVFPFIPLLRPRFGAFLGLIFTLTCAIYPYAWHGIVDMRVGPLLLLNTRNILLVFLLIRLLRRTAASPPVAQPTSTLPTAQRSVKWQRVVERAS